VLPAGQSRKLVGASIDSVRFRNFKALRDVEVHLDPFTVLVGPNASGKTSMLEGLSYITKLASVDAARVFQGRANIGVIASRGARGTFELGLHGEFRQKEAALSFVLAAVEDFPFSDSYTLDARWGDRRFSVQRELSPPDDVRPPPSLSDLPLHLVVREGTVVTFDRRALTAPSCCDVPTPVLGPTGEGLAAVLADMAVSRPDELAEVQGSLRASFPGFSRLRLVRARVPRQGFTGADGEDAHQVWGHEVVIDMEGATDIPAHAASEGVLYMLGLLTLLAQSGGQQLLLIDHIEGRLDARAQAELIRRVRAAIAMDARLQVVATTSSPVVLNNVPPESIRVHCMSARGGSVRIKALTEHPDWTLLKNDLKAGELWCEVGEQWVNE
jgi:predicted ATPase